MLASNIPTKMPVVWASGAGAGFIRTVPVPSQIGINAGFASFTDGFVPLNFINPNAGGVPPWGQDFNGIFNVVTAWLQWAQAGGPVNYDSAFSTGVGGYPQYALIASSSVPGAWWQSQVDNNVTDPDTGGANWVLCTMQQPYLDARYLKVVTVNTFYVNGTTGNDNFNGQSATVGTGDTGPFKTMQGAINKIGSSYSFSTVTVNVAAGTYAGFSVGSTLIANWSLVGSGVGSCFITSVFNDATSGYAVTITNGATVSVQGFTISGYTVGLIVSNGAIANVGTNNFGACTLTGCMGCLRGSYLFVAPFVAGSTSSIGVTGTSAAFLNTYASGQTVVGFVNSGRSSPNTYNVHVTFTGVTFTTATVIADQGGYTLFYPSTVTWTGTPTANRFYLGNATINTQGSGLNWIPGTAAGVITAAMNTSGGSASPTAAGIYA